MTSKYIQLMLFFLLYISCSNPSGIAKKTSGLNIHLTEQNITEGEAPNLYLTQMKLQPEPWISADAIEFYDYSTHLIYLKEELILPDTCSGSNSWNGKIFVVIANGQRCYYGFFHQYLFPPYATAPTIYIAPRRYPDDIIGIDYDYPYLQSDPRYDERIKNSLIEHEQFHAGLHCTLDTVIVFNKDSTATVGYTFTICNLDADNLYVLDPDRMGSNLFHYFTNGVMLNNGSIIYWSQNKAITPPPHSSYWEERWFSKINSGKTLTRTLQLEGYPYIAPGKYYCIFEFPSQVHIEKDKRILSDGRIWIGRLKSSIFQIDVVSN